MNKAISHMEEIQKMNGKYKKCNVKRFNFGHGSLQSVPFFVNPNFSSEMQKICTTIIKQVKHNNYKWFYILGSCQY